MANEAAISLTFGGETLRPLIQEIVRAVLDEIKTAEVRLGDRLQIPEAQSAALLSLKPHQLRDLRLRGEIEAVKGPKGAIFYTRQQLLEYQANHKWAAK